MVESKDIYCRIEARKRLEKKGFSAGEAFLIATNTKNTLEKIIDGKGLQQHEGQCAPCEENRRNKRKL